MVRAPQPGADQRFAIFCAPKALFLHLDGRIRILGSGTRPGLLEGRRLGSVTALPESEIPGVSRVSDSGLAPGDARADRPEVGTAATATTPVKPFSIVVGRVSGSVLVTVHGDLDMSRAARLGNILADLIDGQGNLSVVVDLQDATTTEPDGLLVFTDAAERARRRGGKVLLNEPNPTLGVELELRGLDHFVGSTFDTHLR